jgi:ferric-dicitrate binding protein FerR (iron transport regulator)
MSPEVRQEVERLLSALCDGELTGVQQARLEELLAADAACRLHYLEYMDLHAQLLSHAPFGEGRGKASSTEPAPGGAGQPPVRSRRRQIGHYLGYVLVASATLAASLLVQVFWGSPGAPEGNKDLKSKSGIVRLKPSDYVATLTQTADCVWENATEPPRSGSRLAPGELRFRQGVARIRFDNGPDLTVEGPAVLRIDSGSAATVFRGKVVFRADETASPFDLHTPSSTLVDLGTEYAVAVSPEGEEIHVFDGEVQRRPRTAAQGSESEQLKAGEARRFGSSMDAKGQPAVLDPASFVRRLSAPDQLPNAADALLAYEGFDYADAELFRTGKANGGTGWKGHWHAGLTRPLLEGDKNLWVLNAKEGLTRPGAAAPGVGGCFDYTGFAKYHRRLATPVRLDADGVYYLSFLFRRHAPPADPLNAVAVLLRTTQDFEKDKSDPHTRLNIGIGGANQVFTHFGGAGTRTQVPLEYGETYLLVAKIAVSAGSSSQVFVRVFGPREPVEREEPNSWTVIGPAFQSDLIFDWLEVHVNSRTRQTIDEIRVGTSWPSVAAPWVVAAAAKKEIKP